MSKEPVSQDLLATFGDVKTNKIFTNVVKNGKTAYIAKRRVSLQDFKPEYGTAVKIFTDEEVKTKHLGKVKCIFKFKTNDELKELLTKYFA